MGVLHQLRYSHKNRSNSLRKTRYDPAPYPVPFLCRLWLCVFLLRVLSLLSQMSQSPVNPAAAIFRRHGGLPVGVLIGANGGWGLSPRTPCLWPFRSEAPQGNLVLRAAPAVWVWFFPMDA